MKRVIDSFALGLISAGFARLAATQSLTTGPINGTAVDLNGDVMARVLEWGK